AVLDIAHRAVVRKDQDQIGGLDAELPTDAAARDGDEGRVAPFAARRAHHEHAAAAPPAEDETAANEVRHDGAAAGLLEQLYRDAVLVVRGERAQYFRRWLELRDVVLRAHGQRGGGEQQQAARGGSDDSREHARTLEQI